MARPMPATYLQPDEGALEARGRRGLSIVDDLLWTFVVAGAAVAALLVGVLGYEPALWQPIGLPATVLIGFLFAVRVLLLVWRVQTSQYTITAARVYKAYGRIRFNLLQTTYDKLTDLHVRQSLWGRIWDFGTVRLETAGTGIVLEGVPDPFGFKQQIETARTAFVQVLIGEASASTGTSDARREEPSAVPGSEGAERWNGRPSPLAIAIPVVPIVVGFLALSVAGTAGSFLDDRTAGLGLLALVVAAGVVVNAVIRARFTRYFVADGGVVVTTGWLSRRRVETRYEKVTDVAVYEGIFGRLFGYGNITINTAGSNQAPVVFFGVGQPQEVKQIIDEGRRA